MEHKMHVFNVLFEQFNVTSLLISSYNDDRDDEIE